MNKLIVASLALTALSIAGIIVLLRGNTSPSSNTAGRQGNVMETEGKQVVRIQAKGGYAPRSTTARANVPTVIQVDTNGTYDCSAALAIPSLGIRTTLPPSGSTPIEVPPQPAGTVLQGVCAMGMYNFAVRFN